MDPDHRYKVRICSSLRKRAPHRIAYDVVRRDTWAFKVRTFSHRLVQYARNLGRRPPRKPKLKPKNKPLLMTPLKNIRSLTTLVRANWNPRIKNQEKKPTYIFPADYAAPTKTKEYLGGSNPNKEYLGVFADEEKKPTASVDNLRKIVEKETNKSYNRAG